jgi:hypothetical protein
MAFDLISIDEIERCLAKAAKEKLDFNVIYEIYENSGQDTSDAKRVKLLAQAARQSLSQAERDQVLATAVMEKLNKKEMTKILRKAEVEFFELSKPEINEILVKGTQDALKAIAEKNYDDTMKLQAKEIIDLGLAISGYGNQVKAAFGPIDIDKSS